MRKYRSGPPARQTTYLFLPAGTDVYKRQEQANTDRNGLIPELELPAPPLEYSMAPSENQPYAEYTFRISREGYEDLDISGAEILPDVTADQRAFLNLATPGENFRDIVIPAHTLFGNYPEKIPEDEIKRCV